MKKLSDIFRWSWIIILWTIGCVKDPSPPEFPAGTIEGYRPIYGSLEDSNIEFLEARQLVNPGKIHVVSNFLLINERYRGIHVYNNVDPSNPVAAGFLAIAGNSEFAVKDSILYADHLTDLVAIDITDWSNLQELSRTPHPMWDQRIPPGSNKYFECVDKSKGVVIGWELATLNNPKCFR